MDSKIIDLTGRKGADILVDLDGVDGSSYCAVVMKPGNSRTVYYDRVARSAKLNVKLPLHSDYVTLSIIGKPKINSYMIKPLHTMDLPFDIQPETRRPYAPQEIIVRENYNLPSAARMYTDKPIIEIHPGKMAKFSLPLQVFIRLHELAHSYFNTEWKADRWASTMFLNMGYPLSAANYAVTKVLNYKHPDNLIRMVLNTKYIDELNQDYQS